MQKKTICDLELYTLNNTSDLINSEVTHFYINQIGNMYMCSKPDNEVPLSTLVIRVQEVTDEKLFGVEQFKIDSNEEVDSDATLATFIADSGNGYQATYYNCIPSDIIHLSVVAYDEALFHVIS